MKEQSETISQQCIRPSALILSMILNLSAAWWVSSRSPPSTETQSTSGVNWESPQLCHTLSSSITVLVDESIYTNCPWSQPSTGVICYCLRKTTSTGP